MELKKDFEWIQENCTAVLPPQMFETLESGQLLICWVLKKAIIMDDQDMLEAYLGYCKAIKSWWSITGEKLGKVYDG